MSAASVVGQLIPAFLIATIGYVIVVKMLGERMLARAPSKAATSGERDPLS